MAPTTAGETVDPAAILDEGRRAFAAGDYSRSEEILLTAMAAGANERDCRIHLARICNLLQQWPKALEHWQWLRNWQPDALEPQLQVARALFRLERFQEAAIEFRRVVEHEPDHAEAVKRLVYISDLPGIDRPPQRKSSHRKCRIRRHLHRPLFPMARRQSMRIAFVGVACGTGRPISFNTLLEEGKAAFKAQQFALSQKLFTDALDGWCR